MKPRARNAILFALDLKWIRIFLPRVGASEVGVCEREIKRYGEIY